MILLVVLVLGAYAAYVMTPEERKRLLRSLEDRFWQVKDTADVVRAQDAPFRESLKARTTWPIASAAIIVTNVLVFLMMMVSAGSFGDPATLVSWGASYGPRTTNGEWWRLAAALFVPTGFLALIVTMAGFAQAAITLERLLGPAALLTVYLSAGVFANLDYLSNHPMGVTAGASGAVFGVIGLLLATLMWNALGSRTEAPLQLGNLSEDRVSDGSPDSTDDAAKDQQVAPLTIPMKSLSRMAPPIALFALYGAGMGTPALAGLLTGFTFGLVFARKSAERTTPILHVGGAVGVAAVVILASAAMLRGVADVRPEIARVVALEDQMAGAYEKAVYQFKNGAMPAAALSKLITQTFVPELQKAHARLKAIQGVPDEHQPLVASAEEYIRLRDESWRLRADALSKSNLIALRAADRSERASLEALDRLRAPDAR